MTQESTFKTPRYFSVWIQPPDSKNRTFLAEPS
jgi:hypothetical protein